MAQNYLLLNFKKPNSSIKHFFSVTWLSSFNLIKSGIESSKLSFVIVLSDLVLSIISFDISIYLSLIESITSKGLSIIFAKLFSIKFILNLMYIDYIFVLLLNFHLHILNEIFFLL